MIRIVRIIRMMVKGATIMERLKIVVGEEFGWWTVVRDAGSKTIKGKTRLYVIAECDCGARREVIFEALKRGHSKSCGCRPGKLNAIAVAVGQRFGCWTVMHTAPSRQFRSGRVHRYVVARCDCGAVRTVNLAGIRSGRSLSCGCLVAEVMRQLHTKHGYATKKRQAKEYRAWADMIGRCENPNLDRWENYGGRGIKVCSRWRENFLAFLEDVGPSPGREYSLDRIDVNGNYEPGNCRWATPSQQMKNTRHLILWRDHKARAGQNEKIDTSVMRQLEHTFARVLDWVGGGDDAASIGTTN
jgi:hypothetical protein